MLVFPSKYEGFGLPVLEAMSCGCPVITSDSTSLPEIVGNAGILIRNDDHSKLAEAIIQLSNSKELRAKLRNDGLSQAQFFNWDQVAEETLRNYVLAVN